MAERYALDPVLERIGLPTIRDTARLLASKNGTEFLTWERRLYRWSHAGLTPMAADEVAILIGEHPENLWPGYVSMSCPHCGKAF